ncbi:MAG: metallophosphoesterase [Chitinophagales bacterium]
MDRRSLLKGIGTLSVAGLLNRSTGLSQIIQEASLSPNKVLRIAHITDMHISMDKVALQGVADCLHHLQSLSIQPDIIFNGGDTINDALLHTKLQVGRQWKAWNSIYNGECNLPMETCIGNHDVWGLYTAKKDPMYGKNFAQEMMCLDCRYKSFDKNGWHFILLDSTQKKRNGVWYTAKLDEEQMEWLERDLASVPAETPVMVMSHIPILSAAVFFDKVPVRFGKFHIPGSWMHSDVKEITALFDKYPNVKLCISGHLHLADHVEYNGVHYYCNGAVCGDWWKEPVYQNTHAGYAIIDLYDDGSFRHQYLRYDTDEPKAITSVQGY